MRYWPQRKQRETLCTKYYVQREAEGNTMLKTLRTKIWHYDKFEEQFQV